MTGYESFVTRLVARKKVGTADKTNGRLTNLFFQGNRGLLFLLVFVILQLFRRKKEEKKVITGNRSANNELSLKKMAIIPIMY